VRGFSLVELSIVLVILGLLTGGILGGQSLIRAAELRSLTSDMQRYSAAVNSFRDKYFGLPGDITNATQFWGAAHATPADCKTTYSTNTTCNGDGNGRINYHLAHSYEPFRFWQQLALAGLIEGTYGGVGANSITDYAKPGVSVPTSKLSNVGFFAIHEDSVLGGTYHYDGSYGNYFRIGSDDGAGWLNTPSIKPEELWNIDKKMDDGRPAFGKILSWKSTYSANCTTTDVSSTAEYALTQTGKNCNIIYIPGF